MSDIFWEIFFGVSYIGILCILWAIANFGLLCDKEK